MPKTSALTDERDTAKFLNCLFLNAFYHICRQAEAPQDVLHQIELVIDKHHYDLGTSLRKEARTVARDLAQRILDNLAAQVGYGYNDDDHGWDQSLVSSEEARANKGLWRFAIENHKPVLLHYVSDTSGFAERIVTPTGIEGKYGKGFCHLRKDDRTFRFDKMLDIRLVDSENT